MKPSPFIWKPDSGGSGTWKPHFIRNICSTCSSLLPVIGATWILLSRIHDVRPHSIRSIGSKFAKKNYRRLSPVPLPPAARLTDSWASLKLKHSSIPLRVIFMELFKPSAVTSSASVTTQTGCFVVHLHSQLASERTIRFHCHFGSFLVLFRWNPQDHPVLTNALYISFPLSCCLRGSRIDLTSIG